VHASPAVIVEQLEQECAGISSMLKDVMAVEAEAAAAAEAAEKNKRPRMALVSGLLEVDILLLPVAGWILQVILGKLTKSGFGWPSVTLNVL
jgi:hypothetical protein